MLHKLSKLSLACLLAVASLLVDQASGQSLSVTERTVVGGKIAAEVTLPEGVTDGDVLWVMDADCVFENSVKPHRVLIFTSTLGAHTVEARLTTYETVTILVPDPEEPNNEKKFVRQERRFPLGMYLLRGTVVVDPLSGPQPPGPNPPVPNPPDPDNPPSPPGPVPDDRWGVGQTVQAIVASLGTAVTGQADATAAIFEASADRLETGVSTTINSEIIKLKEDRQKLWGIAAPQWKPFEDAINDKFSQSWPMTKAEVALFLRAIAAGLKGVE